MRHSHVHFQQKIASSPPKCGLNLLRQFFFSCLFWHIHPIELLLTCTAVSDHLNLSHAFKSRFFHQRIFSESEISANRTSTQFPKTFRLKYPNREFVSCWWLLKKKTIFTFFRKPSRQFVCLNAPSSTKLKWQWPQNLISKLSARSSSFDLCPWSLKIYFIGR